MHPNLHFDRLVSLFRSRLCAFAAQKLDLCRSWSACFLNNLYILCQKDITNDTGGMQRLTFNLDATSNFEGLPDRSAKNAPNASYNHKISVTKSRANMKDVRERSQAYGIFDALACTLSLCW